MAQYEGRVRCFGDGCGSIFSRELNMDVKVHWTGILENEFEKYRFLPPGSWVRFSYIRGCAQNVEILHIVGTIDLKRSRLCIVYPGPKTANWAYLPDGIGNLEPGEKVKFQRDPNGNRVTNVERIAGNRFVIPSACPNSELNMDPGFFYIFTHGSEVFMKHPLTDGNMSTVLNSNYPGATHLRSSLGEIVFRPTSKFTSKAGYRVEYGDFNPRSLYPLPTSNEYIILLVDNSNVWIEGMDDDPRWRISFNKMLASIKGDNTVALSRIYASTSDFKNVTSGQLKMWDQLRQDLNSVVVVERGGNNKEKCISTGIVADMVHYSLRPTDAHPDLTDKEKVKIVLVGFKTSHISGVAHAIASGVKVQTISWEGSIPSIHELYRTSPLLEVGFMSHDARNLFGFMETRSNGTDNEVSKTIVVNRPLEGVKQCCEHLGLQVTFKKEETFPASPTKVIFVNKHFLHKAQMDLVEHMNREHRLYEGETVATSLVIFKQEARKEKSDLNWIWKWKPHRLAQVEAPLERCGGCVAQANPVASGPTPDPLRWLEQLPRPPAPRVPQGGPGILFKLSLTGIPISGRPFKQKTTVGELFGLHRGMSHVAEYDHDNGGTKPGTEISLPSFELDTGKCYAVVLDGSFNPFHQDPQKKAEIDEAIKKSRTLSVLLIDNDNSRVSGGSSERYVDTGKLVCQIRNCKSPHETLLAVRVFGSEPPENEGVCTRMREHGSSVSTSGKKGNKEVGVDEALVADAVSILHGWNYPRIKLIIVSSDKDVSPAVCKALSVGVPVDVWGWKGAFSDAFKNKLGALNSTLLQVKFLDTFGNLLFNVRPQGGDEAPEEPEPNGAVRGERKPRVASLRNGGVRHGNPSTAYTPIGHKRRFVRASPVGGRTCTQSKRCKYGEKCRFAHTREDKAFFKKFDYGYRRTYKLKACSGKGCRMETCKYAHPNDPDAFCTICQKSGHTFDTCTE